MIKVSRPKLLKAYAVMVTVFLAMLGLMFVSSMNVMNSDQIRRVGLSYAYEQCLAESNPNLRCDSLKVSEAVEYGIEFYYIDAPYWIVKYSTTEGELFTGSVMLSPTGRLTSDDDLD